MGNRAIIVRKNPGCNYAAANLTEIVRTFFGADCLAIGVAGFGDEESKARAGGCCKVDADRARQERTEQRTEEAAA
jgi:hypothetical protein